MTTCAYCGKDRECRPYGAKGQMICFDCAFKPSNKTTTERMFSAQLDAAGPAVVIGEEVGPYPYKVKS